MAYGFGDQTTFQPYGDDELLQLEGLFGQGMGAPEPPAMPVQEPMTPSVPEPTAPMTPAPAAPMTPPPAMAPQQPAFSLPPAPEPLDTSFPAGPAPPRNLPLAAVSQSGVPEAERDKLGSLYGQLADNQYGAIDRAATTEAGIQQNRIAGAEKRIGAANVEANKAQMALAGQQAVRQKLEAEGAEWSKRKENPAEAFEGIEWAGVLAGIGIGAGTFAQAMGWQHGNPVLEQFDRIVNRSVAAQREQKQSRLQEINARIGDTRASEQILSAQLHDAIADRAEAEQQKATSQEAFDRLGSLVEAERAKVQEMVLGVYERLVPREEKQFARPAPGPQGKGLLEELKDLAELDKVYEERGYNLENPMRKLIQQRMSSLEAGGAAPPVARQRGDTAPQYERDKAQFQNQPQVQAAMDQINELAKAAKLQDVDGNLRVDPNMVVDMGAGEFAPGVQRFFGLGTPVQDKFDSVINTFAKAKGITPAEARVELGGDTLSREQLASRLNEARRSLRAMQPPGKQAGATREAAGYRKKP